MCTLQNLFEVTQVYKIDLLEVREVRWLGMSIIEKDCKMCSDKESRVEKVFIINEIIRSRVIYFKSIVMRL